MHIVIAGGTGFIGGKLVQRLSSTGHRVTVLTRHPEKCAGDESIAYFAWDVQRNDRWRTLFETADAVINLAGESIGSGRWTQAKKHRIRSSRVDATRALVEAIAESRNKPRLLLNMSASGYYGNVPDGAVDEEHDPGAGFLPDVCIQWEQEALCAEKFGTRVVLLRAGVVLGKEALAWRRMILPFRLFAGGYPGTGMQWFPWIHAADAIEAMAFCTNHSHISGAVNLVSPEQVRMNDFCRTLGAALHRPSYLPVPASILKIALGEMAGPLLLEGQNMIPKKLLEGGFRFQYPTLEKALAEILDQ